MGRMVGSFGGPTRFLDWTYSAWVACFFALGKAKPDRSPVSVWAIGADWLRARLLERAPHETRKALCDDPKDADSLAMLFTSISERSVRRTTDLRSQHGGRRPTSATDHSLRFRRALCYEGLVTAPNIEGSGHHKNRAHRPKRCHCRNEKITRDIGRHRHRRLRSPALADGRRPAWQHGRGTL